MKRLPKKEALRLTAEMWEWLGEDAERGKDDWPGWETGRWNIADVYESCFLCQYDEDHDTGRSCESCPLTGKWAGYRACIDIGAPFDVWGFSKGDIRQQAAQLIASLCRDELARLESGRKVAK